MTRKKKILVFFCIVAALEMGESSSAWDDEDGKADASVANGPDVRVKRVGACSRHKSFVFVSCIIKINISL